MQKNRIEVAGYLASKPEIRYLPSGTPVANARLGESYTFKDSQGNLQKHTNWHSLSFYGDLSLNRSSLRERRQPLRRRQCGAAPVRAEKRRRERTVHEIIVRSCHLIAQRSELDGKVPPPDADTPQRSPVEETNGHVQEGQGDPWPVQ